MNISFATSQLQQNNTFYLAIKTLINNKNRIRYLSSTLSDLDTSFSKITFNLLANSL